MFTDGVNFTDYAQLPSNPLRPPPPPPVLNLPINFQLAMEEKNNGYTGGESSKEGTLHGTRCGDVINLGYKKAAYKLPKIYKYDSRIRFKHWLAGFKHFAAVTRIRKSELITVLLTFLCPKSVQRVNTLCLSDVDKSDVNRTLENISKVLEKPNRISVKAKLFKARQKVGLSITEFATKLMDLATDAYPEESQDALRSEVLMDVFLTGLNSEYIALGVLSEKPKTFEEAMNSAIDLEKRMAERGGRNFSNNEMSNNGALLLEDQHEGLALIQCFTCGELGHYEDGCTIKEENGCHHNNQPYSESKSHNDNGINDEEHYDHGQYNDGNYDHEQYHDEKCDDGKFVYKNFDDENYNDGHYDDERFDDGHCDDGQFDDGPWDDGQFDDRHYDDGQFDDRHYDDGQFDDRHYDDGQFDDRYCDDERFNDGSYDDGNFDDGHYDDGNYDDRQFDDGYHDEGHFVEGQYADERYYDGYYEGHYGDDNFNGGNYDEGHHDDIFYDADDGYCSDGQYDDDNGYRNFNGNQYEEYLDEENHDNRYL